MQFCRKPVANRTAAPRRSYRLGTNGFCSTMSRNPETGYRKLRTSLIKVELEECPNVLYNDRALRAEGQQRRVIKKAIQLRLPNNRNRVAWCRGKLNLPLIGCWVRVVSLFIDEFKVEVGANKRANKFREELEKNGTRHA